MQTQEMKAEDRSTEFVSVEGGTESTSAEALLVSAYLLVWAIALVFILLTARKQRALDARLAELEAAVKKAAQN